MAATFALTQRPEGAPSRARGRIETTGTGRDRRVALDATLAAFDVGALAATTAPDALRSRLTGSVRADLRGTTPADLVGDLALRLDDARLARGPRHADLGALTLDATLDPTGNDRLVVESGALSADVTGTLRASALATHGAFFALSLIHI